MKLFDCHNHIQDERLYPVLERVMERARAAGVERMAVKGCHEADWPTVAEIVNRHPDTHIAFGLHPWFIDGRSIDCFQTMAEFLTSYPQASVGEIGIDHALETYDGAEQERVFLAQMEMARKLGRPVTIHCRQAWGRLIELLDRFGELPRGMLIHCFGGSVEMAKELVRRGAYISFSGSITRPNNRKAGPAICAVPDDRILIETDAPDILPVVNHGQDAHATERRTGFQPVDGNERLNEPANLRIVLAKAAELRGVSEENLAQLTFENAERFFNWTHGLEARATRRTGFQPVVFKTDRGQDEQAPRRSGSQPVTSPDYHSESKVKLSENYAVGNRPEEFLIRQGAHLPHWTRAGGVYAATFRLADSLPKSLLASWKTERNNIIQNAMQQERPLSDTENERLRQLYSDKVESYLDAGHGECGLQHDETAEMMQDTLLHFDGQRYDLLAWCIMPNHVHVVVYPYKGFDLPQILHSWKSYSAKQANRMLGRAGSFWQTEYYDHLIRDEADLRHVVQYLLENPRKAGLIDWPWYGVK